MFVSNVPHTPQILTLGNCLKLSVFEWNPKCKQSTYSSSSWCHCISLLVGRCTNTPARISLLPTVELTNSQLTRKKTRHFVPNKTIEMRASEKKKRNQNCRMCVFLSIWSSTSRRNKRETRYHSFVCVIFFFSHSRCHIPCISSWTAAAFIAANCADSQCIYIAVRMVAE